MNSSFRTRPDVNAASQRRVPGAFSSYQLVRPMSPTKASQSDATPEREAVRICVRAAQ